MYIVNGICYAGSDIVDIRVKEALPLRGGMMLVTFTKDEAGNDIIVYHARTEAEIIGNPLYNPNRHAMLMKVEWDNNGPVFKY